jgi:hypothetical protein
VFLVELQEKFSLFSSGFVIVGRRGIDTDDGCLCLQLGNRKGEAESQDAVTDNLWEIETLGF